MDGGARRSLFIQAFKESFKPSMELETLTRLKCVFWGEGRGGTKYGEQLGGLVWLGWIIGLGWVCLV